jgi:hypothetical protein
VRKEARRKWYRDGASPVGGMKWAVLPCGVLVSHPEAPARVCISLVCVVLKRAHKDPLRGLQKAADEGPQSRV